jgi:hypothetical protein
MALVNDWRQQMYTDETKRALLDRIVEAPSIRAACRHVGIHVSTFYAWLEKNDPLEWPEGSEPQGFQAVYSRARKLSILLWESQARNEVLSDGGCVTTRQVVLDGKLCYAYRPDVAPQDRDDPELLQILYGITTGDALLRDDLGRLVPLEVREVSPAPAHLKIHCLKSLIPSYNPAERRESDVRVAGGVMILGAPPKQEPKKLIAAPQPLPANDEDAATERPGDSDLVRDLRRRLRDGVKNARPLAMARAVPDDDDPDDVPPHRPQAAAPMASIPATPRPDRRERADGIGAGPDPHMIAGAQGFKTV